MGLNNFPKPISICVAELFGAPGLTFELGPGFGIGNPSWQLGFYTRRPGIFSSSKLFPRPIGDLGKAV